MKDLATSFPSERPLVVICEDLSSKEIPQKMAFSALPLSSQSSRKVSFAENEAITTPSSQYDSDNINDDPFAPYQGICSQIFNEDQRVVSNETFDSLPEAIMKNKSRSLTSLSRSGDLKSLLHVNSKQMQISSLSENCLLSRSRSCVHEDDDITFSRSSICDSLTECLEPTNSSYCTSNKVQQQQNACSGWGQFVDFIPVDQSLKKKELIPRSRRRNSSRSQKFIFRQHSEKNYLSYMARKKDSLSSTLRKSHLTSLYTTRKVQVNNKKASSSSSTNDIVSAFKEQLSL